MIKAEKEVEIEVDPNTDPSEYPIWYKQYLRLDEKARQEIHKKAIDRIKTAKPQTYQFIKKFKCQVIGITPRTEYSLINEKDGDNNVTFVHKYSMPTVLFWCPSGDFHFSVNAVMKYNDTLLNKVSGNKVDKNIRGLTG